MIPVVQWSTMIAEITGGYLSESCRPDTDVHELDFLESTHSSPSLFLGLRCRLPPTCDEHTVRCVHETAIDIQA